MYSLYFIKKKFAARVHLKDAEVSTVECMFSFDGKLLVTFRYVPLFVSIIDLYFQLQVVHPHVCKFVVECNHHGRSDRNRRERDLGT